MFDNGSSNYEDTCSRIFENAKKEHNPARLTTFRCTSELSNENLLTCLKNICSNSSAKVFIVNPSESFRLQKVNLPLNFCDECEGLCDGMICNNCFIENVDLDFEHVKGTHLPVSIPTSGANTCFLDGFLYATPVIAEGGLSIQLGMSENH